MIELRASPTMHMGLRSSLRSHRGGQDGATGYGTPTSLVRPLHGYHTSVVASDIHSGIAAASQHHKPESATGDRIQDAVLLSRTIFPIVFAAICGKGMKSIALYKSQTGMSLRLLELFSGANSLFSALQRVYLLRSFGIVSIVTTILWLLSPLGGQALSPRLLTKERFYANSTQKATFLGSDFLNFSALDSASGAATVLSRVTTVYLSTLSSSADAFGDRTTSEFTVSSIDLEVRCSSMEFTDTKTFRENLKEPLVANFAGGGSYSNGTTKIVFPYAYPSAGYATNFQFAGNTSWFRFITDRTQPITIFYGSKAPPDPSKPYNPTTAVPISLATCTMLPRGLESKVACEGQVCRAVAARRVPANIQEVLTLMAIPRRGHFCEMGSSRKINEAGQTEEFLASGSVSHVKYGLLKLYETPLADFERRLEQVLSTFYYASSSQIFSTGNFSYIQDEKYARKATAAVAEDLGRHYVCHWVWFGIAAAVVVLLEAVAITNADLRFHTCAPDIFGYVSSLTIGNKYCEDHGLEVSSALDGLGRARAIGRVRFQLANVRGSDDHGRIAFVPLGVYDEVEASRVRLDRYYG
ncbi:hypothetical protein CSOJ01_07300 [Colletotrichum sojae]|uniref:Uncharacterized protein n=1 Tax=Colletotrichum sojae TaxID=2175907 RepID=A0A8H6MTW8_9PEZI|nr:hypothetical protein CSOJ01_07300 [Colletotrichum sojae]